MIAIAAAVALVVCGIFFLLGEKYGVEHMKVVRTTPTVLAQTMLQDEFYSTFRERTVLFTGRVSSITRRGNSAIVTFATKSLYQARCSFDTSQPRLGKGQTITVLSEGGLAQRQSTAVMLVDCALLDTSGL